MQTSGVPNIDGVRAGDGFTDLTVMYESESGYSVLYRAQKGGKWFALKGIKKEVGSQAKYESILRREFDLHKEVTSIYCAECYELITHPDAGLCIVMQYVDGITLKEWLQLKPGKAERRRLLSELLEAIGELHLKQIIHQDIKPANILITNNGHHVKIIDYGLSDNDAYIVRARGCTNKYASPELKAGGPVTFASDIWSLGCIIDDIYPHRYWAVKARCRKLQPEKRYASVSALRKALRRSDAAVTLSVASGLIITAALVVAYALAPHPTAQEIAYNRLVEETHAKYDSCYNACAAALDTAQTLETSIHLRVRFTSSTDSIRQAMQPADSVEKILFNNDYMNYHQKCFMPLQDMCKDKPSIYNKH